MTHSYRRGHAAHWATPRRLGYPAPEPSFRRLLVGALLGALVLLILMVAGTAAIIYFAADALDVLSPPPVIRAPDVP